MPESPVVLLTGAARGLGAAMASALLKAGCRVVLTATKEEPLHRVAGEAGGDQSNYAAIAADLGLEQERDRLIAGALAKFGQVDVVLNNAAFTPEHLWPDFELKGEPPPWSISQELYRRFLEINAVAPHHLATAFLPGMLERNWGRIIGLSTSLDTMLRFWPYGSTKAALEANLAVVAKHLEGTGVTANALLPGGFTKAEPIRNAQGDVVRDVLPVSNMVAPILWLCSRKSDGISGRRIIASQWDAALPDNEAVARSSYPVAWTGLGVQAALPAKKA